MRPKWQGSGRRRRRARVRLRGPVGAIESVVLSDAERDELERRLARLPLVPCEGNLILDCSPCFTTRIVVDGASHASSRCEIGCDEPAMAVDAIAEYLDALAAR